MTSDPAIDPRRQGSHQGAVHHSAERREPPTRDEEGSRDRSLPPDWSTLVHPPHLGFGLNQRQSVTRQSVSAQRLVRDDGGDAVGPTGLNPAGRARATAAVSVVDQ